MLWAYLFLNGAKWKFMTFNLFLCNLFFKSLNRSNLPELVTVLLVLIQIFALVCTVCLFGENVTTQFEKFKKTLCQCDWYLFPIELKQMYVVFVAFTQQTPKIHGYGNIACTRVTFKKVRFSILWISQKQMKWIWNVDDAHSWKYFPYFYTKMFFFLLYLILQTIRGSFSYFMTLSKISGKS